MPVHELILIKGDIMGRAIDMEKDIAQMKLQIERLQNQVRGMVSRLDEVDEIFDDLEEVEEELLDNNVQQRLIIFDDCAYSGSLKNKQAGIVNKILMNGRHLNLSSIITSQKYSLISTGVRSNCTGAVCFNTNQKELELIAEDHSYLEKKSQFISLFRSATKEKNSAMIINYSNPPEQMYQNINFEVLKQA